MREGAQGGKEGGSFVYSQSLMSGLWAGLSIHVAVVVMAVKWA